MIENSAAGLVMLAGEVTVTVTREEQHQSALARYLVAPGGQRHVAVELGWCTIRSGKHRGERAIEVRLDGERVGELTHLMSARYAPLLARAPGRPGCEALVQRTAKGLEIVLRLPRADADPATFVMAPTAPMPPGPPRHGRRFGWIAAGIAAAIVVFGVIGSNGDPDDTPVSATGPTTSEPASTTTDTTVTATATTTTVTTTTTVAPKPKPQPPPVPSPKPAAPPPAQPAPKPEPASKCDRNYTGCVPVASDVDCAGGSGDGPAYVVGPIRVVGADVYRLDNDNDGVACETG